MSEDKKNRKEFVNFVVEEFKYKTLLTDKYKNREKYTPADPKKIRAFIPGKILKVLVKQGEKVKEGEIILVLEAMKMNNQIAAPEDGVIKNIYVKKGDQVSNKFLMIEMK